MKHLVGLYLVDKKFGGPEEGGWYYTAGELVTDKATLDSVGLLMPEHGNLNSTKDFASEEEACEFIAANVSKVDKLNEGRPSINSVLSEGIYQFEIHEATADGNAPWFYPAYKPHYE